MNHSGSFFPVVGLVVPSPENLRVDIWDGEATARWSCPSNATVDFRYNVEMAKYVQYIVLQCSSLSCNLDVLFS